MKREIKFRGKVEKGVEEPFWAYGDLIQYDGGILKKCIHYLNENGYHKVTVNPETVGQFTGLKDKNGKEIFEGDVIAPCIYKKLKNYQLEVVFTNGYFGLKAKKPFLTKVKSLHEFMNLANRANASIEVIGNIHEIKKEEVK